MKNEKGFSLVVTLLAVVIVMVLGLSLLLITSDGIQKNISREDQTEVHALATKGIDYITAEMDVKLNEIFEETVAEAVYAKNYITYMVSKTVENEKAYTESARNISVAKANELKAYYTIDANAKVFSYDEYVKSNFRKRFENLLETQYNCELPNRNNANISTANPAQSNYSYCVVLNKVGTTYNYDYKAFSEDTSTWYTINEKDNDLQKIVTFKSAGKKNDTKELLYTRIKMGIGTEGDEAANSGNNAGNNSPAGGNGGSGGSSSETNQAKYDVPVFLQYAVSTHDRPLTNISYTKNPPDSEDDNTDKEDGSLFLHGGIDIIGDINVVNNLYISQFGKPGYNSTQFSSYPRIMKLQENINVNSDEIIENRLNLDVGRIYLGGEAFTWTKEVPHSYHAQFIKNPQNPIVVNRKSEYFVNKVNLVSKRNPTTNLQDTYIENVFSNANSVQVLDRADKSINSSVNSAIDLADVKTKITEAIASKNVKNCDYTNKSFFACDKGITVSSSSKRDIVLTKINPDAQNLSERGGIAYISNPNNNKLISNTRDSKYKNHYSLYCDNTSISFQGTIFIDGNAYFNNCSISANAIIYATGDVDFYTGSISSYNDKNATSKGTLLIFANGQIRLQGINNTKPNASNIKAYFSAEEEILITGSKSHIYINGGVNARAVELTGMRGPGTSYSSSCPTSSNLLYQTTKDRYGRETTTSKSVTCQNIADLVSHYQNTTYRYTDADKKKILQQMNSRLTIVYNPEIIITYNEYQVPDSTFIYLSKQEVDRNTSR